MAHIGMHIFSETWGPVPPTLPPTQHLSPLPSIPFCPLYRGHPKAPPPDQSGACQCDLWVPAEPLGGVSRGQGPSFYILVIYCICTGPLIDGVGCAA